MLNYIIIFLLPFIQLGSSYYISIQTLLVLLLLPLYKYDKLSVVTIFVFFYFFFIKFIYTDFVTHDILYTFREYFLFLLLLLSTAGIKQINIDKIYIAIKVIFFVLFSLILIQYITINYFSFLPTLPINWFISNQGTLLGIDLALEQGSRLRPVGFYGEPSYAATVFLILYYLIGKLKKLDTTYKYDFLALVTMLVLQSLAGFIIFLFILFLKYASNIYKHRYTLVIFIPVFILILYLLTFSEYYDRLYGLLNDDVDKSTLIRLFHPLYILKDMFLDGYYFGIIGEQINYYLDLHDIQRLDNGLYNIIINYGLGSILIFLIIFYKIGKIDLIILFLLLIQVNGAVFSLDKIVLFSILFGISDNLNQLNRRKDVT